MKCPRCGNPRIKYLSKRSKKEAKAGESRTDFRVKCRRCEYEGEIKEED